MVQNLFDRYNFTAPQIYKLEPDMSALTSMELHRQQAKKPMITTTEHNDMKMQTPPETKLENPPS